MIFKYYEIMKLNKCFFLFLLLMISHSLFAQLKYEREIRLKRSQVPAELYDYVKSLAPGLRVRWHKEYEINGVGYEAKFKHKGQNYSVEFEEDGTLEDLEVAIIISDIDASLFEKLDAKLKAELTVYNILRLQRQILASKQEVIDYFNDKTNLAQLCKNYEIKVWTRIDNQIITLEYLFDSNADIISKLRVIDKFDDNLIY